MGDLWERRQYWQALKAWHTSIAEDDPHEDVAEDWAEVVRTAAAIGVTPGEEIENPVEVTANANADDPRLDAIFIETEQAINTLKMRFPDVLDAEGNLLPTDGYIDGGTRIASLPVDVKKVASDVLQRQLEAMREQDQRLAQRKARLIEYRDALEAIEKAFVARIEALDEDSR